MHAHVQFLPPEGIKVFGNMFHTHTLGKHNVCNDNKRLLSIIIIKINVLRPWTLGSTLQRECRMWSAGGAGTH